MKIYTSLLCLLIIVGQAQALDYKLGIDDDSGNFPYFFVKDNQPTGILIDFLTQVMEHEGNDFEVMLLPRKRLDLWFDTDKINIRIANPDWVNTKKVLIATKAMFYSKEYYYVIDSDVKLSKESDLKNKLICTREGFKYSDILDDLELKGLLTRVDSNSLDSQLRMLIAKRCDALITNEAYYLNEKFKKNELGKLIQQELVDANWSISFIVKNDDIQLFNELVVILDRQENIKLLNDITKKWRDKIK
ncbi:MAG: transporter substrate-binding domain-containing protein [Saccharospirillaceae bacterium]|nr:transporter substrate-binding domain-containing protein [Saccharospirillaceae bacterium]